MPTYEYECRKCKERFETMRRMNANNSKVHCPKCGGDRPQRVLSPFSSGSTKSYGTCSSGST